MSEKTQAMVMASFIGDSLAIGTHWIYDQDFIDKNWGRIDSLQAPWSGSPHRTKQVGQFTHYGDQTLVLLDSIATSGGFDLADFAKRWQAFCDGYTGYFDQATLGTLSGFSKGLGPEKAGSLSNDLAGAARVAPIVLAHLSDPDRMISAARAQTEMTHRDPNVVDSAAFFARSALFILQGQTPIQALEQAAQAKYTKLPVKKWLKKGKEKASSNSVQALYAFGLSCHAPEAFPGVIQLVCRYQDDLPEALIQCVMAGGDSAGRAMLVGLLLGAWNGLDVLPQQWVNAMEEKARIETLIEQIAG